MAVRTRLVLLMTLIALTFAVVPVAMARITP